MKKLIIFDMDGTLLGSDKKILKESVQEIQNAKKKGHKFAIASGRGWKSIHKIINNQFKENPFNFYICHNGAYVRDLKKEHSDVLGHIESEGSIKMAKLSMAWNMDRIINVHTSEDDFTLFVHGDVKGNVRKWEDGKHLSDYDQLEKVLKENEIVQVGIITDPKHNKSVLKNMQDNFGDKYSVAHPGDKFVDINALNINKYDGILKVADLCNISEENIIVFGDANNDLPMFEKAKTSIAMANSTKEILALATEVIGNNDEPSIAKWFTDNL